MIRKTVLLGAILALFSLNQCSAAFEYSGVFLANRKLKESQSYYILLNENTKVVFSFQIDGEANSKVFVSKVALSSGESLTLSNENGIYEFDVPVAGIYEVTVETSLPQSVRVSYQLKVDEEPLANSQKALLLSSYTIKEDKVNSEGEENQVSIIEELQSAEKEDNTENTEEISESFEKLDPDAPAFEELKYQGSPQLIKSIDLYLSTSDKSKCWIKNIFYDEEGNLWVLDGQLCRIFCFDPEGREIISFGSKGKENHKFGMPVSLSINNGKVIVGDRQKRCIHLFDTKGNWLNSVNNNLSLGLRLSNPASICYRKNEIWVADSSANRVLCFDDDFSFLGSFGSAVDGKIDSIGAIASDFASIYILEEQGSVKKFGPMGNFESAFYTDTTYGTDLFIDTNKNIWVVGPESSKVSCFTKTGTLICSINKAHLPEGKFSPSSISINFRAQIAVADNYSKQIKIFEIK